MSSEWTPNEIRNMKEVEAAGKDCIRICYKHVSRSPLLVAIAKKSIVDVGPNRITVISDEGRGPVTFMHDLSEVESVWVLQS